MALRNCHLLSPMRRLVLFLKFLYGEFVEALAFLRLLLEPFNESYFPRGVTLVFFFTIEALVGRYRLSFDSKSSNSDSLGRLAGSNPPSRHSSCDSRINMGMLTTDRCHHMVHDSLLGTSLGLALLQMFRKRDGIALRFLHHFCNPSR